MTKFFHLQGDCNMLSTIAVSARQLVINYAFCRVPSGSVQFMVTRAPLIKLKYRATQACGPCSAAEEVQILRMCPEFFW